MGCNERFIDNEHFNLKTFIHAWIRHYQSSWKKYTIKSIHTCPDMSKNVVISVVRLLLCVIIIPASPTARKLIVPLKPVTQSPVTIIDVHTIHFVILSYVHFLISCRPCKPQIPPPPPDTDHRTPPNSRPINRNSEESAVDIVKKPHKAGPLFPYFRLNSPASEDEETKSKLPQNHKQNYWRIGQIALA